MLRWCLPILLLPSFLLAQEPFTTKAANYRKEGQSVEPLSESTIIAEAEEFTVKSPGWKAEAWGNNYYAGTFANSFLSRKAFLSAPESCEPTTATITVKVPKAGKYLALVRYESVYRFETQFSLEVSQNGKSLLKRDYGARKNLKIWAFKEKLKSELSWTWGAVENVVWEGHDAFVELQAGVATLTLSAGKQTGDAAKRNIDLVMLTSDEKDIANRREQENYLPLDGLLTQAGDVWLKIHNDATAGKLTVNVPVSTEHSPYWVHLRTWKPLTINVDPGKSTEWQEVGSLLDSLNDGQWNITAKGVGSTKFALEFGVRGADGKIESFRKFENLSGNVPLAYDADTRYSRRLRTDVEVLAEYVAYLQKHPVKGTAPKKTIIYGYTFAPKPGDDQYNNLLNQFISLSGATALAKESLDDNFDPAGLVRGYMDVRSVPTPKLADHLKTVKHPERVAVVSLGDEIGLALPNARDSSGFRKWLEAKKVKPSDIDPTFGSDWSKVNYSAAKPEKGKEAIYYYSKMFGFTFGIQDLKARTDILTKALPNAGIGANFSPHHNHMYLGDTHHWITLFREGGMTMPWGEDYIWQVPMGTQQMTELMHSMFRAGIRNKPEARQHFYVMPHWPGNTPTSWRRQFYTALAQGTKIFNLFEYRPVQAAYTENHCSLPEMYQEVRKCFHELGGFEEFVQSGKVRQGQVGLWCSDTADVWDDNAIPFDSAKRTLYITLRQSRDVEMVVEEDDLSKYAAIYLTDRHLSKSAAKKLSEYVHAGGHLIATAEAGRFDEFNQPNPLLKELFAVELGEPVLAEGEPIRWEKQDVPFAKPITEVLIGEKKAPVLGVRSRFTTKATMLAKFADGTAAVSVNTVGKGKATYFGYLPGLTCFQSALPRRPMDRGTRDDSMGHFLPTAFEPATLALLTEGIPTPAVQLSGKNISWTIIDSPKGRLITLVNWSGKPVKGLTVTLSADTEGQFANVSSASGVEIVQKTTGKTKTLTLDLDVADVIVMK